MRESLQALCGRFIENREIVKQAFRKAERNGQAAEMIALYHAAMEEKEGAAFETLHLIALLSQQRHQPPCNRCLARATGRRCDEKM